VYLSEVQIINDLCRFSSNTIVMTLTVESYPVGFKVIRDNQVIIKAQHTPWYSTRIAYECGEVKGSMKALNFFSTQIHLYKDDIQTGEITWQWGAGGSMRRSFWWGRYSLRLKSRNESYYLKQLEEAIILPQLRPSSYSLVSESNEKVVLTISLDRSIFKTAITLGYFESEIDEELICFALFELRSIYRSRQDALNTKRNH